MVGVIEDVSKAPHVSFSNEGDLIIIIGDTKSEYGGSEYNEILNIFDTVPEPDQKIKDTIGLIVHLIGTGLITAANDVSNGGLIASLAEMCSEFGAHIDFSNYLENDAELFSESCGRAILTIQRRNLVKIKPILEKAQVKYRIIGEVTGTKLYIKIGLRELTLSLNEVKRALSSLTATMA
jgi:phosphoribosylformylglycinamidine synthase